MHSLSSSRQSLISLATCWRLCRDIFPMLSSLKSWNACQILSIGSRAKILSVTETNKSWSAPSTKHHLSTFLTSSTGHARYCSSSSLDTDGPGCLQSVLESLAKRSVPSKGFSQHTESLRGDARGKCGYISRARTETFQYKTRRDKDKSCTCNLIW